MPIKGTGWELHVQRAGLQRSGSKERTYGSYQAYQDGNPLPGLSGNICECIGPGENNVADSGLRIEQGRYPLSTQFGRYRTIGYSQDTTTPGAPPMPAVLVGSTGKRSGILIHPGHPPDLYLSSIGCLNPTKPIGSGNLIDFWDSRTRVIALIDDLKRFYPAAFTANQDTDISNAWVVIDGEPMNLLPDVPAGAGVLTASVTSFPASGDFVTIASSAVPAAGAGADGPPAASPVPATTTARAASTSPQDFAAALKATLDQLASYARSPALPDGKPYLFPDGIRSLELSVHAGTGTIVKINTAANAPPQTGETAPHASSSAKLAVGEPTDTVFSTAIPISSFSATAPVAFGSLVPGGFFSANPNDIRVRRSVRTNNPGALNISSWQKTRPGYAGVTPPDSSVNHNVTTIYRTPEHGTAAWYHLLGRVYDIGSRFTLADLARRYAGGDATQGEIDTYVSGWMRFAEGFDASKVFDVSSIDDMTALGVAMFSHEIGNKTPLQLSQIQYGISHEMNGTLPP